MQTKQQQQDEQRLIDGLFSRLKHAEDNSAPRDAHAEKIIAQHLQTQPQASYYMAQTILIQEAALKQLDERIRSLENQLNQYQQHNIRHDSGGFLAGLFGGKHQQQPATATAAAPAPTQNYQPAAAPRSFLSGALQTAAGVAGGVMLADMFTSMFSHSQPQEIVNIIEPSSAIPPLDNNGFNTENNGFLDQQNVNHASYTDNGNIDNGFADNGFTNSDFTNSDLINNDFTNDDFNDDSNFGSDFGDDNGWI